MEASGVTQLPSIYQSNPSLRGNPRFHRAFAAWLIDPKFPDARSRGRRPYIHMNAPVYYTGGAIEKVLLYHFLPPVTPYRRPFEPAVEAGTLPEVHAG